MSSKWTVGRPSDNKAFIATVVIASLLITAFFVGTGVFLYFWIKSWREKDIYGKHISEGEKQKDMVDLEAGRGRPSSPRIPQGVDEAQIVAVVEVSKWRQETITVDIRPSDSEVSSARTSLEESELSSTRSSSDMSNRGLTPAARPRSRDFHELYPSN